MQFLPSIPQTRQQQMCNFQMLFLQENFFFVCFLLKIPHKTRFFPSTVPSNSIFLPCFKFNCTDDYLTPLLHSHVFLSREVRGSKFAVGKDAVHVGFAHPASLWREGGNWFVWKAPHSTPLPPTFMWGAAWKRCWEGDSGFTRRLLCPETENQGLLLLCSLYPESERLYMCDYECYNEEGILCEVLFLGKGRPEDLCIFPFHHWNG